MDSKVKDLRQELLKLSPLEKASMLRGAIDPKYFNHVVRPALYKRCDNDPEKVHEFVLEALHSQGWATKLISPFFWSSKDLLIKVNGIDVVPFGTAAGMDKNGDALMAFSQIFGFQEPGTVVLCQRDGNKKPRVAVDEKNLDIYNAQGFPSKGLNYFFSNITDYRASGGTAIVYASICGLPLSEKEAVQRASDEMEVLIRKLNPYVNGFVWNPFSPNTDALKLLRTPSVFYETARQMESLAPDKLRLVKIGPYEPSEKDDVFKLIRSFINGGGDGVVTTNTKMFPKDALPESVNANWGYPSAGRSGKFLQSYRTRSIKDVRKEFPNSVIVATGGIYTANDALDSFVHGANMLEGLTPYTYFGTGLVREMMHGVSRKLKKSGLNLRDLQDVVKDLIKRYGDLPEKEVGALLNL